MRVFKPFLLFFFLVVAELVEAQDFHFSQFYNSPLTLNPALTGNLKQDFRVGIIHRSQWRSVNSPFTTSAMFADINIYKNPFKLDMWGVGLTAVNDDIGDGIFTSQHVGLSFSGMKSLDQLKRHKVSIGIQPSYVTRGVNPNIFVFDNQVNSSFQVDRNIASGEQLNANKYSFFNFSAGAYWDFLLNQKLSLFAGYSANNIFKPKENPLLNTKGFLPVRHTFNPGLVYRFNQRWAITPSFLLAYQAKATEMNLGLYGAYTFNPNRSNTTTAFLGTWFRTKDAFIAMTGLKWGHYQVCFSYDFTVSSFKDVQKAPIVGQRTLVGAWELSFIYVGFLKRALPSQTTIPCKFF